MQRSFVLSLLLILIAAMSGCATTTPAPVEQAPIRAATQPRTTPAPAPGPTKPSETPGVIITPYVPAIPEGAAKTGPGSTAAQGAAAGGDIALLLPLQSGTFGRAADAVKQGFMAAFNQSAGESSGGAGQLPPPRPVRLYPTTDQPDSILAAYQTAIKDGARVVVGPLTRNGVSALAASSLVTVPTLALNIPDTPIVAPGNLYFLGLSVEAEARQIAQIAAAAGHKTAIVIGSGSPLSKRSQQTFIDTWQTLGGRITGTYTYNGDPATLTTLRSGVSSSSADMIYIATGYAEARLIRPYLPATEPIYGTSQINGGNANPAVNFDLEGVQFVDMPWLLQPDHPAVMIYPRPPAGFSADMERLYALGIDAYRLAKILVNGPPGPGFTLDGVTGTIALGAGGQFTRTLTLAQFIQGAAVVPGAPSQSPADGTAAGTPPAPSPSATPVITPMAPPPPITGPAAPTAARTPAK